MNPPYMGSGNMNEELSDYVKKNYDSSKADLATVFVEMIGERMIEKGLYAFIIPPSWMFLPSFEDFRKTILNNHSIQSLLQLSNGAFGGDFGSTPCVIQSSKKDNSCATYYRLVEKTFQLIESQHLKELFLKANANHNFKYDFSTYDRSINSIRHCEYGKRIVYDNISQNVFFKIPGCPITYWVSDNIIKVFSNIEENNLGIIATPKKGLATTDNNRFLRLWHEVSKKKTGIGYTNSDEAKKSLKKWFPLNKGGGTRKWFGFCSYMINWENDGQELKDTIVAKYKGGSYTKEIRSEDKYFRNAITWSAFTSGIPTFRYSDYGALFDSAGSSMFPSNQYLLYLLGLLNSNVGFYVLSLINPTLNWGAGSVSNMPIIFADIDESLVQQNISISKQDWNAHETSWDFQENELIRLQKQGLGTIKVGFENAPKTNFVALDLLVEEYKAYWMEKFNQLHDNEEELNRKFIEIYGLQDELYPDVPFDEVTILQQGELMFVPSPGSDGFMTPIWREDNIIQQFISYAIGCCMGRYRLDRPGLHIAHPNPTADELEPYQVNDTYFTIDEDAIIPILPPDVPFPDNAANRITNFVKLVFGTDNINGNMNFIQDALGMSVADYMTKNFYTDHKKRYQNRPIYWLFSSKKGAFQCLVYMHRMNRFTVGRIRDNYLLPYIQHLEYKLGELNLNAALLTSDERKEQKRKLAILQECREYDNILHLYADRQIDFDLDDGVLHNYSLFKDILAKLK